MPRPQHLTLLVLALLLSLAATEQTQAAANDDAPPARALDWTLGSWSGVRIDGASPGRTRESRMVSEPMAPEATKQAVAGREALRWSRTMWVSEDDGESWRVLWRDELTRMAGD